MPQKPFRKYPLSAATGFQFVLVFFIISRVVFYLVGIRFNMAALHNGAWQIADVSLLQSDLWGTLWNMNHQPPLFSWLVGVAVTQFPAHTGWFFHSIWLLFGLGIHVMLYGLMLRLGVRWKLAFVFAIFFMISPLSILYENLLSGDQPATFMLLLVTLLTHQYLRSRKWKYAHALMFAIITLGLMRSVFSLPFLIALWLVLALSSPILIRKTIISAIIPFILLLAWYIKNGYQIEKFTNGDMHGMLLHKTASNYIDEEDVANLIEQGEISPLVLLETFPPSVALLKSLDSNLLEVRRNRLHPICTKEYNAAGKPNFNHPVVIAANTTLWNSSLKMIQAHPFAYTKAVSIGLGTFFKIPTRDPSLDGNRRHIMRWDNMFYIGAIPVTGREGVVHFINPISFLVGIVALWYAIYWLAFNVGRRNLEVQTPSAATFVFMAVIIIWVSLVGIGYNLGENYRYRVILSPFSTLVMAVIVGRLAKFTRKKNATL